MRFDHANALWSKYPEREIPEGEEKVIMLEDMDVEIPLQDDGDGFKSTMINLKKGDEYDIVDCRAQGVTLVIKDHEDFDRFLVDYRFVEYKEKV